MDREENEMERLGHNMYWKGGSEWSGAPLSHSPRLRKVMPFVTRECALPRAAVKVLLYPVEREHVKKQRAGMRPKAVTLCNTLNFSACDTDKASSFDF